MKFIMTVLIGVSWLPAEKILGASFECSKATTNVEKAICRNEALSGFDERIVEKYKKLLAGSEKEERKKIIQDQRNWLKQRNMCEPDQKYGDQAIDACLEGAMIGRDDMLYSQILTQNIKPPSKEALQKFMDVAYCDCIALGSAYLATITRQSTMAKLHGVYDPKELETSITGKERVDRTLKHMNVKMLLSGRIFPNCEAMTHPQIGTGLACFRYVQQNISEIQ